MFLIWKNIYDNSNDYGYNDDDNNNDNYNLNNNKLIDYEDENYLAMFVDFCPIRRSHWESCFPCRGSRLLNPGRNFAGFLAKCVFNFPKKLPKFWERVNRWDEKSEVFRQRVNWWAEKSELFRQFFSRHCQPSVPLRNLMTVYRFPPVLPRPRMCSVRIQKLRATAPFRFKIVAVM